MSKERIAGMMMGIGLGVAIGYYLKPRKDAMPAGSHSQPEPNLNSGAVGQKPLSEVAAISGAGSVRLRRP